MKILAIGDVVSTVGCEYLRKKLPSLKKTYSVDFCIVNGENSAAGNGITPQSADYLFENIVHKVSCFNRRNLCLLSWVSRKTVSQEICIAAGREKVRA